MTHTSGPWAIELHDDYSPGDGETVLIRGADGRVIACNTAYYPTALDPKNAHLIAAAPDLLAALKGLLSDIEEYQRINHLGGENNHWQVISRAAIAKAEGRS